MNHEDHYDGWNDVTIGDLDTRAAAHLDDVFGSAVDAFTEWLDDPDRADYSEPEYNADNSAAADALATIEDGCFDALAPVAHLMQLDLLNACSPPAPAGRLPLPPALRHFSECPTVTLDSVYESVGDALRSPDPVAALRLIRERTADADAVALLLDWVDRLADDLAAILDLLPASLRRLELASMGRLILAARAAIAVRVQLGAHRANLDLLPDRLAPALPTCDARPPPTPERCRPAVMLTGPPALRRHPRARTTN